MFEELSALQIWLLIGGAATIAFYVGRMSAIGPTEARAHYKYLEQEEATRDFKRLSSDDRAELDRLVASGKIIDGVKLVRNALNKGLYEAKLVVDQRKPLVNARGD